MVESVTIRAGRQVQLEAMLVCRVPSGQTLLIVTILKPKLVKLISFRDYHHPRLAPDSVS